MNTIARTLLTGFLLGTAFTAQAGDAQKGKQLVEEHCMRCHDTGVYTRQDRKIQSLEALQNQVARCELTQNLKWFDQDREDVVTYLNQAFYHFK